MGGRLGGVRFHRVRIQKKTLGRVLMELDGGKGLE